MNTHVSKILVILIGIFSISAFAGDNRLTKEEFLSGVFGGTISLERAPSLSIPDSVKFKVFEEQRKKFPAFRDEMWYVHYIKDNKFIYTLFFEWWENSCKLRIEEIDSSLGKPNGKSLDPDGQKIDKKYCEKVYGIKL